MLKITILPPSDFGDARAEYKSAHDDCALFDVSARAQLELTGADRAKFLHNFCTNNVLTLKPGQGCEAFCTNVKGRVVGHVFVFCDTDSLWLEAVPNAQEALRAHLERYIITEDVQLHDRTAQFGELLVSGPRSAERLSQLGLNVGPLALLEHKTIESEGTSISIRRVDFLAAPGFLLSCARENLAPLWRQLVDGGIRPAGSMALEVLRIEAVMPLYGIDITDENLAQEVGRTRQAISFTKGCYLGQEPIARIDALGHVNRELRGLKLQAGRLPERGATVLSEDGAKEVGTLTSAARLSDDQPVFALAYLRSGSNAPGTTLAVRAATGSVQAVVFQPEH
ncbi:MAG: glycine cleavage T C-terminal barrel domain-containing protein [Planctomycetaceae bacterium]